MTVVWSCSLENSSGSDSLVLLSCGEVRDGLLHVPLDGSEETFLVACRQQIQDVLVFLYQNVHPWVGDFQVEDTHP